MRCLTLVRRCGSSIEFDLNRKLASRPVGGSISLVSIRLETCIPSLEKLDVPQAMRPADFLQRLVKREEDKLEECTDVRLKDRREKSNKISSINSTIVVDVDVDVNVVINVVVIVAY